MKKLIMFLLVHINPNAIFSQAPDTTQPLRQLFEVKPFTGQAVDNVLYLHDIGGDCHCHRCEQKNKPDTLRAILLVTLGYRQQGIAHARMGFVIIEQGKRPVYLDCNKKALKLPMVGWDWREVNSEK